MQSYSILPWLNEGSRRSAREVVPLVLELIQPEHVIDVGCGVGTWLSVFTELGVEDILGLDGDHVDRKMLEIPKERFVAFDLRKPLRLSRQFDLVVSLEVAEHLPKECAESFVDSLARLGPVILFSAAIPLQGGINHLNEQWPDYWVEHFEQKGYEVIDSIRKRIWQNDKVEWWYAQNILMFAKRDYLERNLLLKSEWENTIPSQLSVVHPRKYLDMVRLYMTIRDIAALFPQGETFILVDHEVFRNEVAGPKALPFLERAGQYWGPPPDDETAIRELERLRQSGAIFIVFAWPAFWWLDFYSELSRYLRSKFRCVLENERLIVFDLRL